MSPSPPPQPPPLPPPLLIRILALINFCQLFFFQPLTSSIRIWESVRNSFKTFSLFKQNLTFIHFKFSRKHHIIIIIKCISFCSRSFFDALWSKKMGDEIKKKSILNWRNLQEIIFCITFIFNSFIISISLVGLKILKIQSLSFKLYYFYIVTRGNGWSFLKSIINLLY